MSYLAIHELGDLRIGQPELVDGRPGLGLRLRSFTAHEEISQLSVFHLETDFLISDIAELQDDAGKLDPSKLLGQRIVFSVETTLDSPRDHRFFSGIISKFSVGRQLNNDTRRSLPLEVVPELWKLAEIFDSRRFARRRVVDLVSDLLSGESLYTDERLKTDNISSSDDDKHPIHDNPVQYEETTLAFIQRLMQQEGVFYYLKDEFSLDDQGAVLGGQKLVLGDTAPTHYSDLSQTLLQPDTPAGSTNICVWEPHFQYGTSHWEARWYDYNNSTNTTNPDNYRTLPSEDPPAGSFRGSRRVARVQNRAVEARGDQFQNQKNQADWRLQDVEAFETTQSQFAMGESFCELLYPGAWFTFDDDLYADDYVVTSIEHRAIEYDPDGNLATTPEYSNQFVCVPASQRATNCPVGINGLLQQRGSLASNPAQPGVNRPTESDAARRAGPGARSSAPVAELAIVVDETGSSADEGKISISRDSDVQIDHVYVKFRWDRDNWDAASRRVRVAQPMAGNEWGMRFLPRVGQEVVVLLIDGNPDHQHNVVIGALNNDAHRFSAPSSTPQMQTVKLASQAADAPDSSESGSGLVGEAVDEVKGVFEDDPGGVFANRRPGWIPHLSEPPFPHYVGDLSATQPIDVPHPSGANVTGIRTRSADSSGGNVRHNELLFDDTHNDEQIYVHAARDMNYLVENDWNIEVRGDKKEIIRGNSYQIICVGNIGPETLDRIPRHRPRNADSGDPIQDETYPPTDETRGSYGVHRTVSDGVIQDIDKPIGVKTVEWVEQNGDDTVWMEKTESYFNAESRHVGDSVSVVIGSTQDFHWFGNALSVTGALSESIFMGNELSVFLGMKEEFSLGLLLFEFTAALKVGVELAAAMETNYGGKAEFGTVGNMRKTPTDIQKINASIKSIDAEIEKHQTCIRNNLTLIAQTGVQINEVKTKLDNAKIKLKKTKVEIDDCSFRIVKTATIVFT